ncbi:MAG: hypothetical protein MJZ97_02145, partial [Bacteroidales bacterium]|nr:hypothetical protein [Bacteroidales bacterium]
SVISFQFSVISFQFSVISYQFSVISYQFSTFSFQFPIVQKTKTFTFEPPLRQAQGAIFYKLSTSILPNFPL